MLINDKLIICLWQVRNRRAGGGRHFGLAHRSCCFCLCSSLTLSLKLLTWAPFGLTLLVAWTLSHPARPRSNITSSVKPALITIPQRELIFFFLWCSCSHRDDSHCFGTNYFVFTLCFCDGVFFEGGDCVSFSKVLGSQTVNKCLPND